MKSNIRYAKYDVFVSAAGVLIGLIAVIVLANSSADAGKYWGLLGYSLFLLLAAGLLLDAVRNIQWFDIENGYVTVYCPFGIMRHVQLAKIKKAFRSNATIFGIKMFRVRRPHIVLCLQKSVTHAAVEDAYNRKQKPYIIIPYSAETELLLRGEYKKHCGSELVINQPSDFWIC